MLYQLETRLYERETDSTDPIPVATDQASTAGDRPDASRVSHPSVQGSAAPPRRVLADQLHSSHEEPYGIRAQGMGKGGAPPDRHPQALQTLDRPMARSVHRALTVNHADHETQTGLTVQNSVLSSPEQTHAECVAVAGHFHIPGVIAQEV